MKQFAARFALLIYATFIVFALCKQADAQVGFAVRPPHIGMKLQPGDSISGDVEVENKSSKPVKIKAEAKDFAYDSKGNLEFLSPEEGEKFSGCANWILIKENYQEIGPGEVEQFKFEVHVPKRAKSDSYRTYLVFSTSSKKEKNVTVVGEVASLLNIDIRGAGSQSKKIPDIIKKGKLVYFNSVGLSIFSPVSFELAFHNSGNVGLKTDAEIEIQNMKGRFIDKIELPSRTINAGSENVWKMDWVPQGLFGKYKAIARISMVSGEYWTKEYTFWVIKWQLLVYLAVLIVFVITLVRFSVKRLKVVRNK